MNEISLSQLFLFFLKTLYLCLETIVVGDFVVICNKNINVNDRVVKDFEIREFFGVSVAHTSIGVALVR